LAFNGLKAFRDRISQNLATYGAVSFYDRRVFLVLSPVFVLNSTLLTNVAKSFTDIFLWALCNTLALLVCVAYCEIAVLSFFSKWQNHALYIPGIAIFGFTVGGLLELSRTLFCSLVGLDLNFSANFAIRFLQNGVLGALIVFGTTGLVLAQRTYKAERALLVAQHLSQMTMSKKMDSHDPDVKEALLEFVNSSRQELLRSREMASEALRQVVEERLRPLSHRLWERKIQEIPTFGWADLMRYTLAHNKVFPVATAVIYFLCTFPLLYITWGFLEGLERSALGSAVILIGLSVGKAIKFKKFSTAAFFYVILHISVALASVNATSIAFGATLEIGQYRVGAVTFLFLLEMNLVFGLLSAMKGNSKTIRQNLVSLGIMQSINRDAVQIQNQLDNRELANFLHGDLQNTLLAAVARLEYLPINSGEYDAELARIIDLLDSVIEPRLTIPTDSLSVQLSKFLESWHGLVEIVVLRCPETTGYASLDATITRVISEGVTNSVRHGCASNIQISVLSLGSGWKLLLSDDGMGPTMQSPGLGSKLFDSLAPGNWSLLPGPAGGSVLTINLVAERKLTTIPALA
jgi:hypothetical protein